MPYFLSNQNLSEGLVVEIIGEEARHILLAHRAKKGEKIKLQGPDGKRFEAEITEIDRNKLKLKAGGQIAVPAEPKTKITLFQSVVSEKALDFIFQKGTELGLSKIVLFNSANTAAKLSSDKFTAKKERWEKILIGAAKQSERAKWPALDFVVDVNQAMEKMKGEDRIFLADISGNKASVLSPVPSTLTLLIGPEGGFTPDELTQFKSLPNLRTISLGPILLRAETAALSAIAVLQNLIA